MSLERIAIADTTIAFISGTIFSCDSSESGVITDKLMSACIYVVDKNTGQKIGNFTDSEGHYQFNLPASTYDLKVQSIEYTTLIIRDVIFGTGDMVEFDALLGQSGAPWDSCVFQMQRDRTLKELYKPTLTKKEK
jgi:hypothetical protein